MRLMTMAVILMLGPPLEAADDPYLFLDATADAISTAMAALESGEMELEYSMTLNVPKGAEPYRDIEELSGRVVWQGESLYAEYTLESRTTLQPGQNDEKTVLAGAAGPGEVIQTPSVLYWHQKDKQWCRHQSVNPEGGLGTSYFKALDPKASWFSTTHDRKYNHVRFGLTWRTNDSADDLTTVTPIEGFPRRRRIVRGKENTGLRNGYIVDLDQGGMVIEGWSRPAGYEANSSSWGWKQDPHGVWYVSHWKHTVYDKDDPDEIVMIEEATVKHFNSRPDVSTNRFKMSSLNLPKGTRVEHVTSKGKWYTYIGGKPPEKKALDLDTLVDDVQDGFAAPHPMGSP